MKVVKKDNGYYELVARDCGHVYSVTTEHFQFGVTEARRRANRARVFSATPCPACTSAVTVLETQAAKDVVEASRLSMLELQGEHPTTLAAEVQALL